MTRKSQISPGNGNEWRVFDYVHKSRGHMSAIVAASEKVAVKCVVPVWLHEHQMVQAAVTIAAVTASPPSPPMFPLQMLPIFGWLLSAHALSLLLPLLPAPPIAILSLWFFLEDTGLGVKRGGHYWTCTKKWFWRDSIFYWNHLCWRSLSHFWEN